MGDLTAAGIGAALERAVRFRREQPSPRAGLSGDDLIEAHRRADPIALGDGWWMIGAVVDSLTDPPQSLSVHWQPATDRVRVDRPTPWVSIPQPPPPKMMDEPQWHTR